MKVPEFACGANAYLNNMFASIRAVMNAYFQNRNRNKIQNS